MFGVTLTPSLSFKIPTNQMKEDINNVLNQIADNHHLEINTKADALYKLVNLYKEEYDSMGYKEIPHSIEETIRLADCDFIKWDGNIFVCYESYHKNKSPKEIYAEHDKVINACYLCKVGKAKTIQKSVENQFRKKGISNMISLVNNLLKIDYEGAVAQIFICQAKRLSDDELVISSDGTHFKCPELEDEYILIDEYCIKQVDPTTLEPPCRYLVAPYLRVPIKIPQETQEIINEIKQLEIEKDGTQDIKSIDVDFEVRKDDIEELRSINRKEDDENEN